ncbi:metallophosphoesterase family protein [Cytobacillus oceanisediminis]|uniref:metallophosphoesterase family protein n=1 Tax=Cytobacillus oceanisediminis TaxID=665099 RepID=UPI001FB209E1|nr:metallophosphoesterase family protein [Cytobacillus oceanisediminis]UOE58208.1 metallophosphoesterase [Cytobacillus oceanisediminis]
MRSYRNSDDIMTPVTKEHLDKAIDIKLELQEMSPSRKTNWLEHKRLMELAGFYDSDTNEPYRSLIKHYQKEVGRLANAQRFTDMIADGKLEAIKHAVGEMYLEKQDFMRVKRELNKVKRELSKPLLIAEEVRNVMLDDTDFQIPPLALNPPYQFTHSTKAIIVITDWHIGATVHHMKGNHYNFKIAQKRIDKLLKKSLEYCDQFGIWDVTVACIGDMVEHINMRNVNQSYEAEFPLAEQIVKATKLITSFIVNLSEYVNVDFFCIAGNHDRFQANKTDVIDTDNVMYVIAENIKNTLELLNLPKVKFIEADKHFNYEHVVEINGKRIKLVHGDFEKRTDKGKIDKHIAADEEFYDAVIMGHFHYFEVIERNYGNLEIRVGSPMGRNSYSRKFKANSDPSQAIIIVTNEDIIPIRIGLNEEMETQLEEIGENE